MPDNGWNLGFGYYYPLQQNWQPGGMIPIQGGLQENQHPGVQGLQNLVQQLQGVGAQPLQQPAPPDLEPEEGNMINDFKVGCDPEFLILTPQGTTDHASKYFPHYGEVGYDHGGRIAEFRPGPSKGVLPIIKKIQTLVNKVVVPGKLRAGALCNEEPLGGHVHFGFNSFPVRPPAGYGTRQGCQLNERGTQVVKALDALTKTLEHLDILPKNESAKRRGSNYGYGSYGDVRDCNGHMEYRTMASWLYDPKVAFLCLTAAKLAAADPEGMIPAQSGWAAFKHWLERYENKDVNAKRATEKLVAKGLPYLQVDPSVDFKGRWEELGI